MIGSNAWTDHVFYEFGDTGTAPIRPCIILGIPQDRYVEIDVMESSGRTLRTTVFMDHVHDRPCRHDERVNKLTKWGWL